MQRQPKDGAACSSELQSKKKARTCGPKGVLAHPGRNLGQPSGRSAAMQVMQRFSPATLRTNTGRFSCFFKGAIHFHSEELLLN